MEDDTERGPAAGEELPESPAGAGACAEDLLENPVAEEEDDGSEGDGDGFSFPVAADACIVPVYPIFGRPPSPPPAGEEEGKPGTATLRMPLGRLLLEEREFRARQKDRGSTATRAQSAAADDDDDDEAAGGGDEELEGVPPESYCLWAPGGQSSASASPRQCRKSGSTGSVLRWRRISERLVGRSHSDGKEKFVFLSAPAAEPPPPPHHKEEGVTILSKKQGERVGSRKDGDGGGGLGHPWSYQGGKGGGAGGRRRSYLPYKQELVGLFANVSGLRRSYHPF
ncbi:hypothetical protein ACP70R_037064 [Stipagrostis hirtigluma subsp. patula]